MTSPSQWLTPAVVSAFGWTLIHFLWQGLALAILLRAGLSCLRTPTARYNAAVLTLVAMTLASVVTFALVYKQPTLPAPAAQVFHAGAIRQAVSGTGNLAGSAILPAASISNWLRTAEISRIDVSRIFVWFWIIGVLTFSLRAIGGWLMVRELHRKCDEQIAPALLQTCRLLQQHLGIHRFVRFCASSSLTVPAVVGWFRPVILLPLSALSGLSAEQLEAVIAHELAHIKRFDAFVNLFQIGAETLLFYHPAVWWVSRSIRNEREHCCDDIAVTLLGNPLDYAKALTLMEEWRSLPAFALAVNSRPLKSRIERLLGIRSVIATASAGWPLGGVAAMAFLGVAGLLAASGSLQSETLNILEERFFSSDAPIAAPAPEQRPSAPAPRAPTARIMVASPAWAPGPVVADRAAPHPAPASAPEAQVLVQYASLVNTQVHTALMIAAGERQTAEVPEIAGQPVHSFIADMDAAGYKNLTVDQLVALKIQGVTPQYVREVKATGLNPDVNQLIGMKIQGVSPAYIADLKAAGIDVDINRAIAMKIQGVTLAYVKEMHATGLNPSLNQIIAMKIQGVTPEYLHEVQAGGFKSVSADQLIAMKIQGVKPADATEFEKLGFKDLSIDDLIALRIQGVSPSYIQSIRAAGFTSNNVHEFIGAKIQGVTPEFIEKAKQHGFTNMSLHQLIALRQADVF
jgi:beta-lactamase regulating signal transducer with metallopeptidase domain